MRVFRVCAVSSCGMLSRQEELSGTSGTNQRRRAEGHGGSGRKEKGKIRPKGEKEGVRGGVRDVVRGEGGVEVDCPGLTPASAGGLLYRFVLNVVDLNCREGQTLPPCVHL